ncbi:MAG TPA: patatin-like phospholipase family protein [Blastocatellia bacterium]|nr:patatin-like phospholipase family protein [Blastocatellia bacterium]
MSCIPCLRVVGLWSALVLAGASRIAAQDGHPSPGAPEADRRPEVESLARSERGRPEALKVGLVLSGGGARGVAHIGVLRWFEEHRIPVDYVAGTSMGGLIGGVYAMGMGPAEIQALLHAIRWKEILSTGPGYQDLSFRRKEDRRAFQTGIEMGLRHGISLPLGLSTDHFIGLLFDRLTLPYHGIKNFDELPIPYRCVATDFLKAEQVVMKDGPLSTAMRATMSIPGVFRPVEREGRVLVDGGLVNNIPTDVMREMGPEVVIAVDVGTPLGELESISSLPGILAQSVSGILIQSDRRNLRLADLIIAPELGNHSLLDFSPIDRLVEAGYQAAERKAAILRRFALDEAQWRQYLERRSARRRTVVPTPTALEITGVEASAQRRLQRELEPYVGAPLDPPTLEKSLTRITGEGRYESLQYSVLPGRPTPDQDLLLVRVNQKYYAPPALNFGLDLDGSDINEINFTVGARLTMYDLGKEGAEWRSDLKLGFNNILASEYFYPLGERGLFVAPAMAYRRERRDFFSRQTRIAQYQTEKLDGGFDLGLMSRRSEVRLGYAVGRLNASVRAGEPDTVPAARGLVSMARLRATFDGQNSATIPTRGLRVVAEGRWFLDSPDVQGRFGQAELQLSAFHPLSRRDSIFLAGSGGTSFVRGSLGTHQFTLGGPFRLGAYNRDELRGDRYLLATAGYLRRFYQLPSLLGGNVYLGGWGDLGGAYGGVNANSDGNRFRQALSAGLVVDTIFGPFSVIGSFGEGGRGKIYFVIGKFF